MMFSSARISSQYHLPQGGPLLCQITVAAHSLVIASATRSGFRCMIICAACGAICGAAIYVDGPLYRTAAGVIAHIR